MESAEHVWIGDQITLNFRTGKAPAKNFPLLTDGPQLTYGQVIALGGDFYGVVGAPISTAKQPVEAFKAAWRSLVSAGPETAAILKVMDEEIAAVMKAYESGLEPSTVYARLGDGLSMRWNRITGGGSAASDLVPMGRYLKLAAENWDHFTGYAVAAYKAGHQVAMLEAKEARRPGHSQEEQEARLQQAYAMNAFADHFLTDLFSAGHLRAPRKELFEQVMTPVPGFSGSLGSLLARCMHDEDSSHGLNVKNGAAQRWVAYGDKRLLDPISKANRDVVVRAVQASADDVWLAFDRGIENNAALQFIPDLNAVADVKSKENFSPLFKLEGGVAARRKDVNNRKDYSWTTDWWGWSTYVLLMGTHSYQKVKVYKQSTGAFLGWFGADGNSYTQVVKNEKDAHPCAWDFDGEDIYMRKETSGAADRFLGLGDRNWANWGLKGGWRNPVIYNADKTISLKDDPKRKLALSGDTDVLWTDGSANANLLVVELPMRAPSMTK